MNSGCYNNDISKVLISITALDKKNLLKLKLKKKI